MTVGPVLRRLTAVLARHEVPYMVAGSFASTLHGMPRTTHDVDLVVEVRGEVVVPLVESLVAAGFYADVDAARQAHGSGGQWNAIDEATSWKIDLIARRDRPFSLAEFGRRRPARIAGVEVMVATAEDTIISKLEWARASGSERQLRDVAGIVAVVGDALDRAYLDGWILELGLAEGWAAATRP